MMDKEELIEKLADLEHEQWMYWSKAVMNELLKDELDSSYTIHRRLERKRERWGEYWKPYAELSEEIKEYDRIWARKVLELLEKVEV